MVQAVVTQEKNSIHNEKTTTTHPLNLFIEKNYHVMV